MPFSPDYVHLVLSQNFEDAKGVFVGPLMAIHYAHLAMLAERGIINISDAQSIRQGLDAIDPDDPVRYDFALCHLGIHGDCRKRRDPAICPECPIDSLCRLPRARRRR